MSSLRKLRMCDTRQSLLCVNYARTHNWMSMSRGLFRKWSLVNSNDLRFARKIFEFFNRRTNFKRLLSLRS